MVTGVDGPRGTMGLHSAKGGNVLAEVRPPFLQCPGSDCVYSSITVVGHSYRY